MQVQYLSAPGNSAQAGLFIPADNLHGVGAGELNSGNSALLEAKFLYGFFNSLLAAYTANPPLGLISFTKSVSDGGTNIFRESVALTFQWVLDYKENSVYPLPIPTAGTYNGVGALSCQDVWPDSELIVLGGGCPGEGVVIYHSLATEYGGTIPASETADARDWIFGAALGIVAGATLRSSTVASAVRTATSFSRQRLTGATFPDTYAAAANPLTDLSASDLPHLRLIQEAVSLEMELEVNTQTQTLEVRVATA